MKSKRKFVRYFSYFIIIYGIIGLIGSLYVSYFLSSFFVNFQSFAISQNTAVQVSNFSQSVQSEFLSLSTTAGDASNSAKHASQTLETIKLNIIDATQATYAASTTLKDTSPLFGTIGRTLDICFLNICPFQGISNFFINEQINFNTVASKLDDMGASLQLSANNMDTNAQDMAKLSNDFTNMSVKMKEVSDSFGTLSKSANDYLTFFNSVMGSITTLKTFLLIFLVWIIFLHLIILGIGISILIISK